MSRRESVIMEIDVEDEIDFEIQIEQAEIEDDIALEQKELEDFENTEVNESEFTERL